MEIFQRMNKPEYFYRPSQIWRRVVRKMSVPRDVERVRLPWGLPISIIPKETIGSCIWRAGVYDLCVSECLWRLCDPGEVALDIGANIGHMTSIMALRLGSNGKLISLEPHPVLFGELSHNCSLWRSITSVAEIELYKKAASDQTGYAKLHIPGCFDTNRGVASLEPFEKDISCTYEVPLTTLEELALTIVNRKIGVVKIDVEGHELSTLTGGVWNYLNLVRFGTLFLKNMGSRRPR